MFLVALEGLKGQVLHMILWMQNHLSTPSNDQSGTTWKNIINDGKNEEIRDLFHDMHAKMDHVIETLERNDMENKVRASLPEPKSIASLMNISHTAFIDRRESRGKRFEFTFQLLSGYLCSELLLFL